jgi:kynurenine formamidase
LKAGFGLGVAAIAGAGPLTPTPTLAARSVKSFSDVIDLTHPLFEGFPTFDGAKWFSMEPVFTVAKEKLNINRWQLMEHTGTHMDAPLHFSTDGMTIDAIPVTDLVVPMAVINITERAAENADAAVTPDDIKAWESKNGRLPEGCCVVMNSGWHKLLNSPKFAGRDDAGKNHTPGFLSAAHGRNQRRCRSRLRRIDFKEMAAPTFEKVNHRTRARSTWPLSVICTGMR